MSDKLPKDMSDRELLIRTYTKLESVEEKLDTACDTIKNLEGRTRTLEQQDAENRGAKGQGKDTTALIIALIAIGISAVSTIINLIGG